MQQATSTRVLSYQSTCTAMMPMPARLAWVKPLGASNSGMSATPTAAAAAALAAMLARKVALQRSRSAPMCGHWLPLPAHGGVAVMCACSVCDPLGVMMSLLLTMHMRGHWLPLPAQGPTYQCYLQGLDIPDM